MIKKQPRKPGPEVVAMTVAGTNDLLLVPVQHIVAPAHPTLADKIIAENEKRERQRTVELAKKLAAITEKDNCLRVRMLDRIADAILSIAHWFERLSEKVRNYNAHTTTVCDIKLAPRQGSINWKDSLRSEIK